MGEPFRKPTEKEIEKTRELYSDPILHWATNTSIEVLNKIKFPKENISLEIYQEWKRQSRLMFLHFPASMIHEELYEIYSDLTNKVWEKDLFVKTMKEEKSIDFSLEEIKGKITIIEVAKKYGIEVKKNMAKCPFHNDKNPSLSLSLEKNTFNCFGCGEKGDIITFYKKLREVNGKKRSKKRI